MTCFPKIGKNVSVICTFHGTKYQKSMEKIFHQNEPETSVKLLLYCLRPPLRSCCSMMPPLSKPEFAWYYSHPHPHPHPQDISPKILAFIFFFNKNNNNNKRNKVSIY